MAANVRRLVQIPMLRWSSTSAVLDGVTGGNETSLYRRLSPLWATDTDITSTLDEWAKEGKPIKKLELVFAVKQLRKFKKYDQAIQLYDWMDKSPLKASNSDRAMRIKLFSKAKGIHEAENYFNSLQEFSKTKRTYGALLNCYIEQDMFDKASSLAEKMRETNTLSTTLNYHFEMNLYMRTGQPEKVPLLVQEMAEKNIPADIYTYNQLINSYGSMKNFEAMDGVITKIKSAGIKPGWFTYANLANVYAKAGLAEDALSALQKIHRMRSLHEREAFYMLMKLHAQISNKAGVYWAWESLKTRYPVLNNYSYLVFLSSLSKLGDMEGLERYFKEWESCCSFDDLRVPNVVLGSYLDSGMINEAKMLLGNVKEKAGEPNLRILRLFMNYHLKQNEMELALGYLEEGLSKAKPELDRWFLDEKSVTLFLSYFEKAKNGDVTEKLYKFMQTANRVHPKLYRSLLHTSVGDDGEPSSDGVRK